MNATSSVGLYFLDTNVLVYSFDINAEDKREISRGWIAHALQTQRGVISSQVIQEFLNLALRKFARPMRVSEAREYLRTVLQPLCQHFPSVGFYDHALLIKEQTGFALYDSLIVTAAVELKCTTLFSEDMQHGRVIEGVKILDPFRS